MAEAPTDTLDRLTVRGIEAYGHHGVLDFERRDGQLFVADLVLFLDTRQAARSDDLRDTVDYGSLVAQVRGALESDPVDLLERLADRVAGVCLADPRVRQVEVTVHKPGAPVQGRFADVTLTIRRTNPRPPTSTDRSRP